MRALTSTDDRRAAEPEALLLLRAAEGDSRAFTELARMLARPSLGYAVRVLGDRALAEDAVQEALTRLWREAHRFDPGRGSFAGWWRRILTNCAIDGRRRLRPVTALDEVAEFADDAPDPEDAAHSADIADKVQQAAAGLPARQRAALSLFHGDGLSMAEIAATIGSSEKAVEGLLLRGRAALKQRLIALKEQLA